MKFGKMKAVLLLGLATLFTPANIAGCGTLGLLGGCGIMSLEGNGEFYVEYGTKIAVGHHTEKADETQVASSSVDWDKGPVAWLFEWLLKADSPTQPDPTTPELAPKIE